MNIVLAEGNDLVRLGLKSIVSTIPYVKIVGEARDNDEFVRLVSEIKPDVVVIDYTSCGFNIDVVPKAHAKSYVTRFLAITPEQSASTLVHALKSGIYSYVKKDCSLEEIVEAVKETGEGKKFFCGQILETIQRSSIDVEHIDNAIDFTCEPVVLTDREIEIIKLIAEGLTNMQIAEQLFLSNHTVNTHRKNILSKLGVKNTAGIVMYAVKAELISPNKFLFQADL